VNTRNTRSYNSVTEEKVGKVQEAHSFLFSSS